MFEITNRPCIFFSLAPTATSFLHGHYFFITREVYVENARVFARVHQICKCWGFRPEDAGTETNTHVVVIHFVLMLTCDDLVTEETHQIVENLSVEFWQLVEEIEDERYFLLWSHNCVCKDV